MVHKMICLKDSLQYQQQELYASCDQHPTLDILRTYLLELLDMHEIENLSYVAKGQEIMYNETIE